MTINSVLNRVTRQKKQQAISQPYLWGKHSVLWGKQGIKQGVLRDADASDASHTTRFLRFYALVVLTVALSTVILPNVSRAALSKNTVVGKIFDEPVHRAELRYDAQNGGALTDLKMRILGPVLREYRTLFHQVFKPKAYELQAALTHLEALHVEYLETEFPIISARLASIETQLKQPDLTHLAREGLLSERAELAEALEPPDVEYVWTYVTYWKFQRHLYDVYGGGRVVMQDYGPEAIDATVNWLQLRESEGDFTLFDPRLREAFYAQWLDKASEEAQVSDELWMAESVQMAEDLRYDRNRYRLLNPGWMRVLYKSILDSGDGDAAIMVDRLDAP